MLPFWRFLTWASLQHYPFLKMNTSLCVCAWVTPGLGKKKKSKQAENREVTLHRALPAPQGHQEAGNILPATATASPPAAAREEREEALTLPRGFLHTRWQPEPHAPALGLLLLLLTAPWPFPCPPAPFPDWCPSTGLGRVDSPAAGGTAPSPGEPHV